MNYVEILREAHLNNVKYNNPIRFVEPIEAQEYKNEVRVIKQNLKSLADSFQLNEVDIESLENILNSAKSVFKHYNTK